MTFPGNPEARIASWFSRDDNGLLSLELTADAAGFRLLADIFLQFAKRAEDTKDNEPLDSHAYHIDQNNHLTELSDGSLIVWSPPMGSPTDNWILQQSINSEERSILTALRKGPVPLADLPGMAKQPPTSGVHETIHVLKMRTLIACKGATGDEKVQLTPFGQLFVSRL